MNGGKFLDGYVDICKQPVYFALTASFNILILDANYLLKCLQGYKSKGITAYAVCTSPHPLMNILYNSGL